MATTLSLWSWLTGESGQGIGVISGPASYYESGQAQAWEYAHALRTAWNALAGLGGTAEQQAPKYQLWKMLVDTGVISGPHDYYASGQAGPAEFEHAFAVASQALVGNTAANTMSFDFTSTTVAPSGQAPGTDVGGGVTVSPGAPAEETQAEAGVGATESLKILTSSKMSWYFDNASGLWYVGYKLPNSDKQAIFEATPQQMDALFGQGMRPTSFQTQTLKQLTANANIYFSGSILEVEGTGTFESEVERVLSVGLAQGRLPSWAEGDPKVMDLVFLAQSEDWSNEKLINEISKLASFQARFPGLKAFTDLNLTLTDAVGSYLDYEGSLKGLLDRYGMADRFSQQSMAQMLNQGISIDDASTVFENFKRMQDHQPALTAFNEILAARGMDPLTANQQFEFMAGTAPTELYDIWEESSFREAAVAAGLGGAVTAQEAIALAQATPGLTSLEGALEGLQEAAQNALRFRTQIDLGRLDIDDLIDLSLGIAPRSGRSQAELGMELSRIVREAQGFLEKQASTFYGFQEGRPQAQSLAALQPVSA